MKRILLLNNSRIKDLDEPYLKTIFNSQHSKLPIHGDPIRLELRYRKGGKTFLLFRLDNKKFHNSFELLDIMKHFLFIEDPNLKYDKIYLCYKYITIDTNS